MILVVLLSLAAVSNALYPSPANNCRCMAGEYNPVCGSDYQTYPTECLMRCKSPGVYAIWNKSCDDYLKYIMSPNEYYPSYPVYPGQEGPNLIGTPIHTKSPIYQSNPATYKQTELGI